MLFDGSGHLICTWSAEPGVKVFRVCGSLWPLVSVPQVVCGCESGRAIPQPRGRLGLGGPDAPLARGLQARDDRVALACFPLTRIHSFVSMVTSSKASKATLSRPECHRAGLRGAKDWSQTGPDRPHSGRGLGTLALELCPPLRDACCGIFFFGFNICPGMWSKKAWTSAPPPVSSRPVEGY